MQNTILGRFPLVRGTIILLAIFSVSPVIVAGLISLQEERVENQIAKVSSFADELNSAAVDALDLRIGGGKLRPASVDPELVSWGEMSENSQPPPDCFLQYGDRENVRRMEICVAYPDFERVEHLYFYIDYCAASSRAEDELFEISLSTLDNVTSWWLPVQSNSLPAARLDSADGEIDRRMESAQWNSIATSQRCPGSISKKLLRLRLDICPDSATATSRCADYVNEADLDDWFQQVSIDVTRHATRGSNNLDNTVSSLGVRGIRRGDTEAELSNLVADGEVIYFGRCGSDVNCACFQGFTSYIDSPDIEPRNSTLRSLVGAVLREDFSNYCATSLQDEWLDYDKGNIWINYERSPNLNLNASVENMSSMLPLMGYSALALLLSAFFVYILLGRPLENLTAGLVRSIDLESDASIDVPYVEKRNEIGTVARAFREILLRIQSQLKKERRMAAELQIKLERDRDINSIIAHEIKSPFHNLKNKYPDNLDIERIDTALQAILRLDQAVQSSTGDVTVVDISDYIDDYIANKDDIPNIVLTSRLELQVELRGMLLWLVLDNITANADRFRSNRASPIEFELIETENGCLLHVTNDGPSIPADKMDSIFNLRYSDNRSAKKMGSANQGIGLFVSRYYMRMLGGDLAVIPNENGVTFEITLRRAS